MDRATHRRTHRLSRRRSGKWTPLVVVGAGLVIGCLTVTTRLAAAQIAAVAEAKAPSCAAADPHGSPGPARITVTGEGTVRVAPDLAVLVVAVEQDAATAVEAQNLAAEAARRVLAALQGQGVAREDIQTEGLGLHPVREYDERTRQERHVGFRAVHRLSVRLQDLQRLGTVLDSVVAAGVTRIDGVQYRLQDEGAARREALAQAVVDAAGKAAAAARAAGCGLGRLLELQEVSTAGGGPVFPLRVSYAPELSPDKGTAGMLTVPVEEGMLAVGARVVAVYELADR